MSLLKRSSQVLHRLNSLFLIKTLRMDFAGMNMVCNFDFRHYSKEHLNFNLIFHRPFSNLFSFYNVAGYPSDDVPAKTDA